MQRYKALSALSAHLITFKHQSFNSTVLMQNLVFFLFFFIFNPHASHWSIKTKYFVAISSIWQLLPSTQVGINIKDYTLRIMGLKELVYCDGSVSSLHWRMMPSGLSVSQSLIWYLWHNILYNVLDLKAVKNKHFRFKYFRNLSWFTDSTSQQ